MESTARQPASSAPAQLRLVRETADTLPDPLSSFVGREAELREVARLLDGTRLLSLTGAGGSGKTRLAIEAARRAHARFADGVWWVELAAVEDSALLATTVLNALGERAQSGRTVISQLTATIAEREILLVLDNCEHLVAECARLAATLLRAAPRLHVLATSREALNVPGETVWPVPTLPNDSAIRLFEERARAAAPSFHVTGENAGAVGEICRRLDGLPLAVELAAARVTALTPAQIAERLDDCFRLLGRARHAALPRHETLRATIDWSYALLDPAQRDVLARLSVFAGGCTLAAAEAVCAGESLDRADVFVHVCALVDRSLVIAEMSGAETRYRLLETVRQYAAERLDVEGDGEIVRRRHAGHFAATAERAAAERYGPARDALVTPLHADLDNIRAALRWSGDHDDDLFVRLAFGLGWCYFAWGLWWEGRDWLERALTLPGGMRRDGARAQALYDIAYLANYQCDIARAKPALEEALAIYRERGETRERAHVAQVLAQTYLFENTAASLDMAFDVATEAKRALQDANDWLGVSWASATLGGIHAARGEPALGIASYDVSRQLGYRVGHQMTVAIGCMGVASLAITTGNLPNAAERLREGLAAHRKAPDYMFLAWTIGCAAMYAAASGKHADATRLLGADQMLRRYAGAVIAMETFYPDVHALVVRSARETLGDSTFDALLDEGRRLDAMGAIALAELVVAPESASDRAEPAVAAAGPALRVVSLGAVRVERYDVPVPLAEWKYAKARELLFLLLLHPEGRTREQIGLALWPEVSAEQLRANLHPVLHHLRRVLGGPEWIVHEAGVYRFDRSRDFRFDVDELEALMSSAASMKSDSNAVTAGLARLVELYQGDLLEQEPPAGDWHVDRQGLLRRRYLETLATFGSACMSLRLWRDAEDAWRLLVARDNLNELAYRQLMRCYEQLGERREALRVYERLVTVLREDLDAEPDPETLAVLDRMGEVSSRA
jgi:predicted ATPase/DNA-binding SARP family transcriptional activator